MRSFRGEAMTENYKQDEELAGRLRQLRERVRAELEASSATPQPGAGPPPRYPYIQPLQLEKHLADLDALYAVREQPFRSQLPLIGPLVAWFRERWNRIATKWYVQPMLEQQVRFNTVVVKALQELYTTWFDLIRRMDALFYPLDQEQAALRSRLHDLVQELRSDRDRLLALQSSLEQWLSQAAAGRERQPK